ncbi:MAG: carbohydrate ABC transporter permease [Propionibacteriaceae bacterium]|jgi:multiple sugar transport system permease protein|nr:carbohydrate ABC transporter permease [Propionibacteriaceae bacterium]
MKSETRRRPRAIWPKVVLYALMAVMSVPFVFPTLWMILSSFKPQSELFRKPPALWPERWTVQPYIDAVTTQPFLQQYWNSVYIATLVTLGTMLFASMAGYAFARIRFPGANAMFLVVLVGMMIPSEVTIVPLFRAANALGLLDTHVPLIVIPMLGAPSVLATFIMRQFFLGLPTELEEAGRLDGLGRAGIFTRIALPLAKPALSAVAIITFLKSWNLYLEPLVFISTKTKFTLPVGLTQYQDAYGELQWNTQLAGTTMTVIPVLLVFLFAQKQFVQGLAQTGLKG